jgi:hypothetical protein
MKVHAIGRRLQIHLRWKKKEGRVTVIAISNRSCGNDITECRTKSALLAPQKKYVNANFSSAEPPVTASIAPEVQLLSSEASIMPSAFCWLSWSGDGHLTTKRADLFVAHGRRSKRRPYGPRKHSVHPHSFSAKACAPACFWKKPIGMALFVADATPVPAGRRQIAVSQTIV